MTSRMPLMKKIKVQLVVLDESEGCLLLYNFLLFSQQIMKIKNQPKDTQNIMGKSVCCQTFYLFIYFCISLVYKPRKGAVLFLPALQPTFQCTQFILGIYNTVNISLTTLMIFQVLFFICFFLARLYSPQIQRQQPPWVLNPHLLTPCWTHSTYSGKVC